VGPVRYRKKKGKGKKEERRRSLLLSTFPFSAWNWRGKGKKKGERGITTLSSIFLICRVDLRVERGKEEEGRERKRGLKKRKKLVCLLYSITILSSPSIREGRGRGRGGGKKTGEGGGKKENFLLTYPLSPLISQLSANEDGKKRKGKKRRKKKEKDPTSPLLAFHSTKTGLCSS